MELAQDTTFADHCNVVARSEGKCFDEKYRRFYTLLHVAIAKCKLIYRDKHETKNNRWESWRDLVYYYYRSINDESKIFNIERKIMSASYFKEEAGLNYK